MGRRQASLWTPVPRMPTVAPGPKARSGLASRRSEGSSSERRGPQKPAASVDAWRLIGRGRLRFPTLPRQLLDLTAGAGAEYRGIKQWFPYRCNETKDQPDGKAEITMEPKTVSPPEPFAGEDHFRQDSLY